MSLDIAAVAPPVTRTPADYSLTGDGAARAVERGLAEADWYQSPVPRAEMRKLLQRRDGPAIFHTLLWFALLGLTAWGTTVLWGTWWAVLPYMVYAVLYGTASDSRWHEMGHGTAFATDWMNRAVYEIASFMVMRESTLWHWSHTRHHSDTIVVGRDPEIQVPRPVTLWGHFLSIFCIGVYKVYFKSVLRHAFGSISEAERTFLPETAHGTVVRKARIIVLLYAATIAAAVFWESWLPVMFIIVPHFFGTWLMIFHNTPQHAGLAENVLDHRLNCRTVYMNPISRFIYSNMNYHVEHHMFPLVPYHALPKLHALIKDDCPPPYPTIISSWREILPAVWRQRTDPAYHVKRVLPEPRKNAGDEGRYQSQGEPDAAGWLEVCAADDLGPAEVIRFDHERRTFAVYRDTAGALYATDGFCTHGNTHLSQGFVKGQMIECSKHNGRFHLTDGSPARTPVCQALATYPVEDRAGRLWLNVAQPGGAGARPQETMQLRVVSNQSVATFIKELVLEPLDGVDAAQFTPGDYLQFDIPEYERIDFRDFDIPEPYATVWEAHHVFDLSASNNEAGRRNNYSLANNLETERQLRFNVRIATPPPGQDCPPGIGSSYVFGLKPGDTVAAIGPFGDFHIKPTQKEMVYIGGGAGMAPMRAHLAHLLENEKTARKISYWYGARSRQELFYDEYFENLAAEHANFTFHRALSAALPEDEWTGHTGFIHQVVLDNYLASHVNVRAVEFYLCGPPQMVKACTTMLTDLGVRLEQIAADEF